MSVQIRKASRKKVRIKMGFTGPAGSGKTYSALLTAKGLCGDWEKVVVIDTENRSADLYSHLGGFSVIEISAPYTPEKFVEAIKAAEAAGMEVVIVDSASAEWSGKGGILAIHSSMAGNSFTNWGKVTPRHDEFIDTILQANCHVICTLRTKTDYVLVEKNGKQVPEKVGLKAETRDNMDYELTLVFDMDAKNNASASKDRTSLFMHKPQFVPAEEHGRLIKEWCESGIDAVELERKMYEEKVQATKAQWQPKLDACNTQKELVEMYNRYKADVDVNPLLQQLISNRRNQINGKTVQTPTA